MEEYLSGKKACELLGVHARTLYQWDKKKLIETIRTPGGKRLYNVKKYLDNIENDFEPVLDKFLKKLNNNEYTPREWFIKNYGEYNSGKRLKEFVQSVFKESELNVKYDDVDYMKPGI